MLYHLALWLSHYFSPFNVFQYISFRSFIAFLFAFFVVVFTIPLFVNMVKQLYLAHGGVLREYLDHHEEKKFTPSLGGLVLIASLLLIAFIFMRLDTPYPYLVAITLVLFGAIGFLDDFLKIVRKDGISAKTKLALQFAAAAVVALFIMKFVPIDTKIHLPLLKDMAIELGPFYFLWAVLLIVASSNAVNLTDGLDGLAIGASLTTMAVLGFVAYLAGNYIYAHYLYIPYVPFAGELTILALGFLGAGLAFLWHNTFPAKIFMGDVGSLTIGALLAVIALVTKSEFIFFFAGGLFFIEMLSVILQVGYFKYTKKRYGEGKRILLMAPLHHHFEKLGWKEPQIVVRLWIVSILLGIASLTLLKLR